MTDITVFNFESFDIRYVGDGVNHEWIAQDVCKVLGLNNVSQALSRFSSSQKGIISNDTLGGIQSMVTVTEAGLYRLIFKSRKKVAERFQNWVTDEVLPSIRKTGSYSLEENREELERQFLPKATLKEIDQCARMLGKRFGKAYEESYVQQQLKRHQPHLLGDTPEARERTPLKSARAKLTPTEVASEIGVYYKTGKPSPRKVNSLLESLGYQVKVQGKWSATGTGEKHSDRLPVSTNSKTDQDQLFWYDSILPILKEHVTEEA